MHRRLLIGLIAFSALLIVGVWYDVSFSMEEASGFEIGNIDADIQLLIAYQGSPYKNRMVEIITEHYFTEDVYLKGIDIKYLNLINPNHWDALLIIHTWQVWQPPSEVKSFLNSNYDGRKMVVYCTSSSGRSCIEGVDAITSASIVDSVYRNTEKVLNKMDSLLQR